MARHRLGIFLHLVWSTAERTPCIKPEIERRVHRSIQAEVRRTGAIVLALGGMEDHIHLIVALPTTLAIADLMQRVKGVSAYVGREIVGDEGHFRWQHGYGAFTLGPNQLPQAIAYVRNQRRHHAMGKAWTDWEVTAHEDMPAARPRRPRPIRSQPE